MFKKLLAVGMAGAAMAISTLPAGAWLFGPWGFPFWAPWGSGCGCFGFAATGIHLFPWCW